MAAYIQKAEADKGVGASYHSEYRLSFSSPVSRPIPQLLAGPGVPSPGTILFDFFRGDPHLGEEVRQKSCYLASWAEEKILVSSYFIYSLATNPCTLSFPSNMAPRGPELCWDLT